MKLGDIHRGSWDTVQRHLLEQARAIGMSLIIEDNAAKRRSIEYQRLRRWAGRRPDGHLIKPIRLRAAPSVVDLRLKYARLRASFAGPIPLEYILGEEARVVRHPDF